MMNGKICMVTGANKGLGKEIALGLARQHATVILVCRNPKLGQEAVQEIQQQSGNSSVKLLVADLASQQSIRQLAELFNKEYERLDVLVNNAGGIYAERQKSEDGIELTLAVNYYGTFMLNLLLLKPLLASGAGRIVNTSSMVMSKQMNWPVFHGEALLGGMQMYGQSKLAVTLHTYAMARKLQGMGVAVNAVHPGFVYTDNSLHSFPSFIQPIVRMLSGLITKPEAGAQTALYLAASSEAAGVSGKYWINKKITSSVPVSHDEALQDSLWQYSEEVTGTQGMLEAALAHNHSPKV
ncbi:SDR family NAD(P)-dependent oxidoreductase [Paenibacillaceae bacterium]|nr:SDR family NAD(P)-dependent oxidoreductase [Paenibacillaceae bacterium]